MAAGAPSPSKLVGAPLPLPLPLPLTLQNPYVTSTALVNSGQRAVTSFP
jgi:hypothetical protein